MHEVVRQATGKVTLCPKCKWKHFCRICAHGYRSETDPLEVERWNRVHSPSASYVAATGRALRGRVLLPEGPGLQVAFN